MAQVKTIVLRAPATIVYPSGAARATPRETDRAICPPTRSEPAKSHDFAAQRNSSQRALGGDALEHVVHDLGSIVVTRELGAVLSRRTRGPADRHHQTR